MNQQLDLNRCERPWLSEARDKSSNRAVKLGINAINALVQKNENVTYSNIVKKSKELDPENKGIHQNTIRTNSTLYEYYKNHSSSFKSSNKNKRKKQIDLTDTNNLWNIKFDRDTVEVQKRYRKLRKEELIERLIMTEQFIAGELKEFLSTRFKSFPKE